MRAQLPIFCLCLSLAALSLTPARVLAQPAYGTSSEAPAAIADGRVPNRPLTWNLGPQLIPFYNTLIGGGDAEMAIVGDSISFRPDSYNWFLKARFDADYGSGGEGFLSPSGMDGSCEGQLGVKCGVDLSISQGTWISTNSGERNARCFGLDVDGNYALLDVSQSGIHGRMTLLYYASEITVHYVKEPGAGTFQVFINGTPIATYDANTTGDPEHATLTFPTGSPSPDLLSSIVLKHISGGQVFIDGFEMDYTQPGFVYHRLARGGAGPANFLNGVGDPTGQFLAQLDPELILVVLDWTSTTNLDAYVDNMHALLAFYEAASPNSKFILVTHHAFKEGIATEADWMYEIARERGHGYINLFDLHPGGFSELNGLGFLVDEVHLTAAGGQWFGDYIYGLLENAGRAASTADYNRDNTLDISDVIAFVIDFAGGGGGSDLNADGLIDSRDVSAYLDAFTTATR